MLGLLRHPCRCWLYSRQFYEERNQNSRSNPCTVSAFFCIERMISATIAKANRMQEAWYQFTSWSNLPRSAKDSANLLVAMKLIISLITNMIWDNYKYMYIYLLSNKFRVFNIVHIHKKVNFRLFSYWLCAVQLTYFFPVNNLPKWL